MVTLAFQKSFFHSNKWVSLLSMDAYEKWGSIEKDWSLILKLFNKVFSVLSFFYYFPFYFLGNQTWVVRRNPLPHLVNFMSSRYANMKVKNSKEEWQETTMYWMVWLFFQVWIGSNKFVLVHSK